ncbi:unnamed protein product, partial [marine sediment metagenome]
GNLYELFYPRGKKIITREILNRIGDLGLAVWYMDDGHLSIPMRAITPHIGLSTQGFTLEENKLIVDWFEKKYDFHFRISQRERNSRNQISLKLHREKEIDTFLKVTKPYMVPCMIRKWNGEKVRKT